MKSIFILLFLSFGWPGYSQTTASAAEQKDSPVKIGTYKFIPASAGKPGHIEIKFTNISGKKVKQVWFHWQELNAQGDSLTLGEGDITSGYKPQKVASATFSVSDAVMQVNKVFVYEVAYADDTKWKLSTN